MPPENRRRRKVATGPDMTHWSEADRRAHLARERLTTPVAEMQLSVRVINTLEERDIILCEDLVAQTYESLMRIKNFGDKTLGEVKAAMTALGIAPPKSWDKPPKPKRVPRPRGLVRVGGLDLW